MFSFTHNPLSSLTDAPQMRGADQGPRRPTAPRKPHTADPTHPLPVEAGPRPKPAETGASGSPPCGPVKPGHPAGMTVFGVWRGTAKKGSRDASISVIPAQAGTQIHAQTSD